MFLKRQSDITLGELGGAELLTVPLLFEGGRLELNFDMRGQGSAYVELQVWGGTWRRNESTAFQPSFSPFIARPSS